MEMLFYTQFFNTFCFILFYFILFFIFILSNNRVIVDVRPTCLFSCDARMMLMTSSVECTSCNDNNVCDVDAAVLMLC